jgi:hypothetical protein
LVERIANDRNHLFIGEARNGILNSAFFLTQQGTDVEKVGRIQGHGRTRGLIGAEGTKVKRPGKPASFGVAEL